MYQALWFLSLYILACSRRSTAALQIRPLPTPQRFEIQAPTPIHVNDGWASFNWSLDPSSQVRSIGIWLYQRERRDSCPQGEFNYDSFKEMWNVVPQIGLMNVIDSPRAGQNSTGKESIRVWSPGDVTLCAYSINTFLPPNAHSLINSMTLETSKNITFEYEGNASPSTSPDVRGSATSSCRSSYNLSNGGIAGIAVGTAAFFALLVGLYLIYRRLRNRKSVNTFDKERMVRRPVPLASMGTASPTVRETMTSKDTSGYQSFSTLPEEKEKLGPKSDVEDGLVSVKD